MLPGTFVNLSSPDHSAVAENGAYYTAGIAPGGTAIEYANQASFSATAAWLVIQNADLALTDAPFAPNRNLHMKYIRFSIGTPPASATSMVLASVIDTGNRTPTASTTTALTVNNAFSGVDPPTTAPNVWAPKVTGTAAITVPAAVAASTIVGNLILRTQIPVALDDYFIQFGDRDAPSGGLLTAAAAGPSSVVKHHPPLVLAPQHYALFYLWFPGGSGATPTFPSLEVGFTML